MEEILRELGALENSIRDLKVEVKSLEKDLEKLENLVDVLKETVYELETLLIGHVDERRAKIQPGLIPRFKEVEAAHKSRKIISENIGKIIALLSTIGVFQFAILVLQYYVLRT